jgi:hypothetical protein
MVTHKIHLIPKPVPTVKHLEYVYFNIYNYYQQRSISLTGYAARLQTIFIASLSIGGWVLLFQTVFLRIFRHAWFTSQSLAMTFALSVYLITALLFYQIFIVNNYDEKIVNKYETSWANNPNKQRSFLICALVAAAPYLLLLIVKLLFPRSS